MKFPTKIVLAALVVAVFVPSARAALEDDGKRVIQSMSKLVDDIVKGRLPRVEREARFRTLFQRHFNVRLIGRWVLGRPWRTATPAQRAAYMEVFETYIVKTYTVQLSDYGGDQLRVVGAEKDRGGVAVISHIEPRNKRDRPIVIRWRLHKAGGQLLVRDVIIDGISMSLNQRREFASVYAREGSVDGLIATLRRKIAELDRK